MQVAAAVAGPQLHGGADATGEYLVGSHYNGCARVSIGASTVLVAAQLN